MKILFFSLIMTASLNAFSSDGYNKCTESTLAISKQIQSIEEKQQQRDQGLCNPGLSSSMCNIEMEVYKTVVETLQLTIYQIQQYCAEKYGQRQQQQQQQHSSHSQQRPSQIQQVQIEADKIIDTRFNVLVLCDGYNIRHLKEIITSGNCVLPSGQAYQQPQSGACSYRSIYLEKGQNFTIGQQIYFCE